MSTVIKSAKAFFEAANQQQVIARLVGGNAHEDWDKQVEEALKGCAERNIPESDITITEDSITIILNGRSRFLKRSKIRRVRHGIMNVQSKRYSFIDYEAKTESWGDKKGSVVVDNKLEISTLLGTKIVYEIVPKEEQLLTGFVAV